MFAKNEIRYLRNKTENKRKHRSSDKSYGLSRTTVAAAKLARVSLYYFSLALIHLVALTLSPNCTFVYYSGNISLELPPKSHPSVAPYSKWILCAEARSEGRELYLAEGNTTPRTDSVCASWKLLPTSRLNLLWMNAREQIRVKSTIRDGNYDALQIKAISNIFQLT